MKNTLLISLCLSITFLGVACSKKPESETNATLPKASGPVGSFSATINGVPWKADKVWNNGMINIAKNLCGYDTTSRVGINLSFDTADAVEGKVINFSKDKIGDGVATYTNSPDGVPGDIAMSSAGNITLTKVSDQLIEGTFACKAGSKHEVTDGKFSVNLNQRFMPQ
jgi:hypothetical protein